MKVKIKRLHPDAVIPTYAKEGDAGMDLTAISTELDASGNLVCHTGLAFEIPQGHVGLVFPRSSIHKKSLTLTNSVGVVDSGYRGEVTVKFARRHRRYFDAFEEDYKPGDRVAQLVIIPYPHIELEETDTLTDTDRGTGGYGSTGR